MESGGFCSFKFPHRESIQGFPSPHGLYFVDAIANVEHIFPKLLGENKSPNQAELAEHIVNMAGTPEININQMYIPEVMSHPVQPLGTLTGAFGSGNFMTSNNFF